MIMITKIQGPKTSVLLVTLVTLICLAILLIGGFSEPSVNLVLIFTARAAFVLFVIAFSASSIYYFYKSDACKWLIQNRRYIGITFGLVWGMHFLAIALKVGLYPKTLVGAFDLNSVLSGGNLLATVLLLTITSSDYVMRRVRPVLWKAVHVSGSFYIFYRFWLNYYSSAEYESIYYVAIVVLALSGSLKFAKYIHEQSNNMKAI